MTSVIIIINDPDSPHILSEYLSLKDIRVLATGDSRNNALELYKEKKPDVVIIDNYYSAREIKQYDLDAKILICTEDEIDDIEKYEQIGIKYFCTRPYEIDQILGNIKELSQ